MPSIIAQKGPLCVLCSSVNPNSHCREVELFTLLENLSLLGNANPSKWKESRWSTVTMKSTALRIINHVQDYMHAYFWPGRNEAGTAADCYRDVYKLWQASVIIKGIVFGASASGRLRFVPSDISATPSISANATTLQLPEIVGHRSLVNRWQSSGLSVCQISLSQGC